MISLSPADGSRSPDQALRDVVDCLDRGDAGAALERLTPLLAVEPPDLAACFALAMTAWQLERFDWALSVLGQCHAMAPDNGGVAEALASLQAQLGQLEDSLYTGKLATALGNDAALAALVPAKFPTFDRAFLSIVEKPLLGKAREARHQGKLTRAVEMARQHVAIEPQHIEGRVFQAECLLRAGAAAAAVETLRVLDDGRPLPSQASLYARALTAVGERQAAVKWHREAVAAASDDAAIAAAQIADAVFLGVGGEDIATLSRDWAARFALAPKPARKHVAGGKLVIGYLVSAFVDPDDASAVAAVAQAHDRRRVAVLGFGLGRQTGEQNGSLVGAFSKWRDIGALDPATLARTLSGDGVDVLVDAGGFASAAQLRALTRFDTALRVSWLGNPAGILAPLYDTRLAAADYPVLAGSAAGRERGNDAIAFGADVGLAQLDARTVALWTATLTLVPDAKLVLRARDMDANRNVARLIGQFGETLAARIDLRQVARTSDFYQAVDIALLPLSGASPRAAAEALAHGVPVVAMSGEPYGAFLSGRGLGQRFVAEDGAQYCALAAALARSADARALPALETGADKLARAIEELAVSLNRREKAA
jgi:predicted O-linked N-acetylglucosamine transferase (SPINDLY family)